MFQVALLLEVLRSPGTGRVNTWIVKLTREWCRQRH